MSTPYSWLVGPQVASPEAYLNAEGELRDINNGEIVPWREGRMLIVDEVSGLHYFTWVDKAEGYRKWQVSERMD